MTAIRLALKDTQLMVITLLAVLLFVALVNFSASMAGVIFRTIADAYIQVSSFVAATLFIFYGLEKIAKIDAEKLISTAGRHEVILASLLGALPGCGGAIIVITQYVTGRLSFGSVIATLTATMGDAAFILLAQEPLTGFSILCMSFTVGMASGYITNWIHGADFMRPPLADVSCPETSRFDSGHFLNGLWLLLIIPGFALGLAAAFQFDLDAILGSDFLPYPATTLGAIGGILSVYMFVLPSVLNRLSSLGYSRPFRPPTRVIGRVISDTNFVTVWVVAAFLLFEISVHIFGINLHDSFRGYVIFAPLIATLLGFIPGCGPQIIVTTLYLAGAIPLSAQISNAISNDGDALFPALAIAPKAALMATIYSAIPALLLGYGWMFFVEGF